MPKAKKAAPSKRVSVTTSASTGAAKIGSDYWSIVEFAPVDVKDMVAWLKTVPLAEWPQQSRTELKPSMVSDLMWRGFGSVAWPVVHALGFHQGNTYQHMVSVVMPGHHIEPHKDQQAPYWAFRMHVPLIGNDESYTEMDDGKHFLQPGTAYKVNVLETHAVYNKGKSPRIHFMFDVRD